MCIFLHTGYGLEGRKMPQTAVKCVLAIARRILWGPYKTHDVDVTDIYCMQFLEFIVYLDLLVAL